MLGPGRGVGVRQTPIFGEPRSLTRPDLELLREVRPANGPIQKLRDPHHRYARAVAAGLKQVEISALLGVSAGRISSLMKDPAFQDLVSKYRAQADAAFIRSQDHFAELATSNMLMAESMLREKLEAAEETGEFLPTKDLLAISRDAADRFGYGKRNMNLNVNVDFASMLEKARVRSAQVIKHRPSIGSGGTTLGPSQSEGDEDVAPVNVLRRM